MKTYINKNQNETFEIIDNIIEQVERERKNQKVKKALLNMSVDQHDKRKAS